MAKTKKGLSLSLALPWILLIGGIVGLLSSIILTVEHMHALENPGSASACDLNPIFSCTSVSSSSQAAAFGIFNPILGIAGYAAVTTVGAALLAGASFKRWFWLTLNGGLLASTLFLHWLIFQTLYRIGALCLFCMITWAVTIPMFWYATLYNLREGNLKPPKQLARSAAFVQRHHADILIFWFVVIIALILKRFWYYWSTLI